MKEMLRQVDRCNVDTKKELRDLKLYRAQVAMEHQALQSTGHKYDAATTHLGQTTQEQIDRLELGFSWVLQLS